MMKIKSNKNSHTCIHIYIYTYITDCVTVLTPYTINRGTAKGSLVCNIPLWFHLSTIFFTFLTLSVKSTSRETIVSSLVYLIYFRVGFAVNSNYSNGASDDNEKQWHTRKVLNMVPRRITIPIKTDFKRPYFLEYKTIILYHVHVIIQTSTIVFSDFR